MRHYCIAILCLLLGAAASAQVRVQRNAQGGWDLLVDGQKTYIKGIGGTNRMDVASAAGANACRTWSGSIRQVQNTIADAKRNNMYIMQGIGLTKDPKMYENEEYKNRLREQCRELAETFKDDPNIIMWGIGNEIELNGDSTQRVRQRALRTDQEHRQASPDLHRHHLQPAKPQPCRQIRPLA